MRGTGTHGVLLQILAAVAGSKFHFGENLASPRGMALAAPAMSSLPTADLLALDTAGLKSRLSKLRRYL